MKVGELFLALGLIVEDKEWSRGQAVIEKMAADMKKLAVNAVLATTDVKKAMATIGISAPAKAAKKTLADMVNSGDRVTSGFRRMIAAAAGFFAVSRVKGMVEDVANLGGRVDDLAQQTGLGREALQEWGYAAMQSGASQEAFADGTKKLAKGLADAASTGKGPVVDALRAVGLSMSDPAVKGKNLDQIINLVASRFETMPDGVDKTSIAMALFGKSGAELIPTLNNGQRALGALRQEARDLGIVIADESVRDLATFGDEIDTAKSALVGLRNQAITALLPVLRQMVTGFSAWVKNNKELIRSTLEKVVSGLATALQFLGAAVAFAVDHWKVLAAILAAGAIYQGLMSLIRLIVFFQAVQTQAAVQAVINWIMILGPILLIAAAVIALGLLIYKFRDKIKAALGKVKDFFVSLWQAMKSGARRMVEIFESVGQGIVQAFKDAFDWVINKAKEVGNTLRNLPVIKQLGDAGQWIGGKLRGEWIGDESAQRAWKSMFPGRPLPKNQEEYDAAFRDQEKAAKQGAGGPAAAASPRREPVASNVSSSAATIRNSYSIQIDAKNADAKEVAALVDQKLKEHDETTRRQTAASLGVA